MALDPIEEAHVSLGWDTDPVFITVENARISADGMLRNFGKEASHVCAQVAAKWAARNDAHAQDVWRTIQQLVDRNIISADRQRGGSHGHIRAMLIQNPGDRTDEGWAVQRADPNGLKTVVTRLYDTEQEAANEAARLAREAARGTMA